MVDQQTNSLELIELKVSVLPLQKSSTYSIGVIMRKTHIRRIWLAPSCGKFGKEIREVLVPEIKNFESAMVQTSLLPSVDSTPTDCGSLKRLLELQNFNPTPLRGTY